LPFNFIIIVLILLKACCAIFIAFAVLPVIIWATFVRTAVFHQIVDTYLNRIFINVINALTLCFFYQKYIELNPTTKEK